MATDDSTEKRPEILHVELEGVEQKLISIPMDLVWPAGDPVARDCERLIIKYSDESAKYYGLS